ncbi:MAG: DUF350 domain-containing protein [Spirochaetes bacterium]|nr:MAG: DUF350 domain-containing protein [Spirochaetota bacterium]
MDEFIRGIIYIICGFIFFFIGKVIYDLVRRKFKVNVELIEKDNQALAIALVGYYLGLIFSIGGSIVGPTKGLTDDLIDIAIYGFLAILLLNLSSFINDRFILRRFSTTKEIIQDQNIGTGIVEGSLFLASGLIIFGAVSGEGGSVWTAVIFWLLGQFVLVILGYIYNLMTPFDIHEEIEKDNIAVGVAFSGAIIAVGNIVRFGISGPFISWFNDITSFVAYVVIGFILLPLIRLATDKVILPGRKITEEIVGQAKPNIGVAYIEAFSYIGASLFIGWAI